MWKQHCDLLNNTGKAFGGKKVISGDILCVCYSKAGITEVFEGHHGPVTGLSCHSAGGPVDFSHLFISSSFDWTVKLWSTKVRHKHSHTTLSYCYMHHKFIYFSLSSSLQSTRPLYSFEDSCDYVYDAMWSPTHPALFACVDLAGRLDLWNLNNDTEVRTHTHKQYTEAQFKGIIWLFWEIHSLSSWELKIDTTLMSVQLIQSYHQQSISLA